MLRFIKKLCKFYSVTFTISIHLMLRFILSRTSVAGNVSSFQYISCYGLSKKFSGIRRKRRDFNTSHVTVYLQPGVKIDYKTGFQYISCYGLSSPFASIFAQICYFNTSHVTVYRTVQVLRSDGTDISIHLMLRFILPLFHMILFVLQFQYISCYGLSLLSFHCLLYHHHFNTSHVTVYHLSRWGKSEHFRISIHLMLRFIRTEPEHI